MPLPSHIESELRAIQRKRGWTELDLEFVKETLAKLAELHAKCLNEMKKAA